MSPGSQGTRSRMASRLTGNKTSSGWSDNHSSFMRLSADRCVDRVRLMAAVLSITDIDAFHKVGQVSKGLFRLKNNDQWMSIFLQSVVLKSNAFCNRREYFELIYFRVSATSSSMPRWIKTLLH